MAEYIVSARKYRPANFSTVVGQKSLLQTLKNAVKSGKLAHAYLFCGPRGVGKTTCARIFAKTINCEHPTTDGEACGECQSCKSFQEGWSYNISELDAASHNSVDDIRELTQSVSIPPQVGKYKVFIIDEVHMLSNAAFNAFLKTLEEPPAHAIFIMATTERQKILPTILSRCQTYDFQRITVMDIVEQLQFISQQEGIQYETQGLMTIARKADGGMRDALSIFDQIVAFTSGNVTYQAVIDNLNILDYEEFFQVTNDALTGNLPAALVRLDKVIRRGFDPQHFIGGWAAHMRDLMVSQDPVTASLLDAGQDLAMRFQQQAAAIHPQKLYQALQIANQCDFDYRNSRNKRLSVEIAIIKICQVFQPVAVPAAAPAATYQQAPIQQAQVQRPAPVQQTPVQQQTPIQQPLQRPVPQQQAPIQQTPVQQPATMPRATMVGRGSTMLRTTPSIHGATIPQPNQQAQTIAPTVQQTVTDKTEQIDPSALRRYWKLYTQTIPSEKLLIAAMLGAEVNLSGNQTAPVCEVTAYDDSQAERIKSNRPAILGYLRQNLQNGKVEINVTVSQEQSTQRAFTPREKLMSMMQENGNIKELVETFGLELG